MPYRKATIRPYKAEDESRLFSLARESFGGQDAWSDRATIAGLERDTVFVADLEGDHAGYVALKREGDAVRIEQLLVSPRHEHEGIGRRQAGRRRDDLRRAATNQGQKRNERASTPHCCI